MDLGQWNELSILRFTSVGAYLGDEEENDVLMPNKYLTENLEVGQKVKVFLYNDSEDRLVATTEQPKIELHDFAFLKIKEVNLYGAFADWGLEKDLLIPFKEQNLKLEEDKYYLVFLDYDPATSRLFGSTKTKKYFRPCKDENLLNQEVDLLIAETSELGVKVVVDNQYQGLIFKSDVHQTLKRGSRTKGYIYNIREDGKVDIRLEPEGYEKVQDASTVLLNAIKERKVLFLSDKSDPDEIREQLGMSKKTFKQALGKLYKEKIINILPDRIEYIG